MAAGQHNTFQHYVARSAHLFWDVDPQKLDAEHHKTFVIERILRFGQPTDIQWLLGQYTDAAIRSVIVNSRNIDRKTAAFWSVHLNIPREEISCFSTPSITDSFY